MKYVRMLGLLGGAVAALLSFAGTASASTITSSAGTPMAVGSTLEITSTNTEFHGPFTSINCKHALVVMKITQNGTVSTTTNAGGEITTFDFGQCSSEVIPPKVLGTLEINKVGEAFLRKTEIAILTSVGECVFNAGSTGSKLGTLTGGTNAVLDVAGTLPRTGGSFFCGSTGQWTGNLSVLSPNYLSVH